MEDFKNPEERKITYSGGVGRLWRGGNEILKGIGSYPLGDIKSFTN